MTGPVADLPLESLLARKQPALHASAAREIRLDQFPGVRTARTRGSGLEFDDLRQYAQGDDVRHIDWNVTARTTVAYTRLYREERERTTNVVVDFRASMFTGSQTLQAVRAGKLAASILWQANALGDRCGATVYTGAGISASRPASGTRGVLAACELIAREFEAARFSSGASERDLGPLMDYLNRPIRNAGNNILLSAFNATGQDNWRNALSVAGHRKHLLCVLLVDDLETRSLPEGHYRYRNKHGHTRISISPENAQALQVAVQIRLERLMRQFKNASVPTIRMAPDTSDTALAAQLAHMGAI